jgi:hypothetical protein
MNQFTRGFVEYGNNLWAVRAVYAAVDGSLRHLFVVL